MYSFYGDYNYKKNNFFSPKIAQAGSGVSPMCSCPWIEGITYYKPFMGKATVNIAYKANWLLAMGK